MIEESARQELVKDSYEAALSGVLNYMHLTDEATREIRGTRIRGEIGSFVGYLISQSQYGKINLPEHIDIVDPNLPDQYIRYKIGKKPKGINELLLVQKADQSEKVLGKLKDKSYLKYGLEILKGLGVLNGLEESSTKENSSPIPQNK